MTLTSEFRDWPPLICADCFHEQRGAATLCCEHHRARATFDAERKVWVIEWPREQRQHP